MSQRLLLVDDDRFLLDGLQQLLIGQGYEVETAFTGAAAIAAIESQTPALAVLDLGLPDDDGIDLCRRIRASHTFPIIMLTSRMDLMDKVVGLEVGADDYLTKPFEPRELVARIRAALRRSQEFQPAAKSDAIAVGPLQIDFRLRQVRVVGEPIALTPLEFRLLEYLVAHRDRVLDRETLFQKVWGYDESFNSNSLDVFVYRLRNKLEKASGVKLIHTARGFGYRFGLEADDRR
ncbi:MAG: response regulator transcription factor [Fimbriimonadaceae bacterium]|nr:response regulator transcription factor [Fimbriimonadaceae bacterium]